MAVTMSNMNVSSETLLYNSSLIETELDALEERLRALQAQADEDAQLIHAALEKADQAKNTADKSVAIISTTTNTLDAILGRIANMSGVDASALDDLLDIIDNADLRLFESKIDSRYADLEATTAEIDSWLANYAGQLAAIQLDIDNVRQINATLPRECFKKIDLEPVEPDYPEF